MEKNIDDFTVNINTSDKLKCRNCVFATNPYDIACAKYKFKPSKVLYENEECEKYKTLKGDEDND